jgi:hypothetical protein
MDVLWGLKLKHQNYGDIINTWYMIVDGLGD